MLLGVLSVASEADVMLGRFGSDRGKYMERDMLGGESDDGAPDCSAACVRCCNGLSWSFDVAICWSRAASMRKSSVEGKFTISRCWTREARDEDVPLQCDPDDVDEDMAGEICCSFLVRLRSGERNDDVHRVLLARPSCSSVIDTSSYERGVEFAFVSVGEDIGRQNKKM